jgi:hypothetical protein
VRTGLRQRPQIVPAKVLLHLAATPPGRCVENDDMLEHKCSPVKRSRESRAIALAPAIGRSASGGWNRIQTRDARTPEVTPDHLCL